MKDLKHIYELEKMLEECQTSLARDAQAEGRYCVGSVCENVPEPL